MPPLERLSEPPIRAPKLELSAARVERGRGLYGRHCARCHGVVTRSTGVIPDLKRSSEGVHESWNAIVLGGVLSGGGMASFADLLDEEGSDAIHAYVVFRALHEPSALQRLVGWLSRYACVPARWLAD